ncbi:uncharacterized protein, partial [Parasteatoda tepidariorum]|uniref:uncharacterized protein n=1 Tax=Parasteatoda tepidariorum TaxID=114398 RepID=UPI001C7214E1
MSPNNFSIQSFFDEHFIGVKQNTCRQDKCVMSVFTSNQLPIIEVKFNRTIVKFLLDTGSSVSLLGKHIFTSLQQKQKIRRLSRQVSITTINSNLDFEACIEASFKIQHKFFKHPLYIIPLLNQSFHGILGYDFIVAHNILIHPQKNFITIQDEKVQFCHSNVDTSKLDEDTHLTNDSDIPILHLSQTKQEIIPINKSGFRQSQEHKEHSNHHPVVHQNALPEQYKVVTNQKVKIHPKEAIFIQLRVLNILQDKRPQVLFIPCIRNKNIKVHEALHTINKSKFTTVIENMSDNAIHINKDCVIGEVYPNFDIDPHFNLPSIEEAVQHHTNLSNPNEHIPHHVDQVNLIQASEDIIKLRKEELTEQDFEINHLSYEHQSKLKNILMSKFSAFSKSLKTLGHTDKISPDLKFKSFTPIKTQPFPIPEALQDIATTHLKEMLDADIIERTVSPWACPLL